MTDRLARLNLNWCYDCVVRAGHETAGTSVVGYRFDPRRPHGKSRPANEGDSSVDLFDFSSSVTNAVRDLIGEPEITLFQDNLVWKLPGSGQIEWHQDYSYQPITATPGVTLWVSLDDADPENGCLHYIAGTHLLGECQPADFVVGSEQPKIPGLPPLDWESRADEVVSVSARPGEILAHHPLVWHFTPPNNSARQRRAFTINWITPDARWNPAHSPHPFNYYLAPAAGKRLEGELFPRFRAGDRQAPSS